MQPVLFAEVSTATNVWDAMIVVVPSIFAFAAAYLAYRTNQSAAELRKDVAVVSDHVAAVREQGNAAAALTTAATASDAITAAVAAGMAKAAVAVPTPVVPAPVPEPSLGYGPEGHL